MPNDGAMADYEAATRKVTDALPADDPDHAKFKELLAKARDDLRRLADVLASRCTAWPGRSTTCW